MEDIINILYVSFWLIPGVGILYADISEYSISSF